MQYEKPRIVTVSARHLVEALGPAQAGAYGGAGGNSASPTSAIAGGSGGHVQKI